MAKASGWIEIDPPEKLRIYHFGDESQLRIFNVAGKSVDEEGRQRVRTTDGTMYVVKDSWLWMYAQEAAQRKAKVKSTSE